ncbi:hypothetical protein N657DRAFT_492261 [Parathielavia appendiculata]|uniref:Zn(2)-C6 fungal-type domain-containing protein n=1 Tax=Parathielavia appendiculata TaxID=2587402 RepID=A0AAN6TX42_9PEZI|nr:hypothetical protein N657DRAFT_492261 [Parathielavia appendiculata]
MASESTTSPQGQAWTPASTFSAPPTKPPRILACILCQGRKIKCDRNFPCANCIKSKVKCIPSTPAPARKRRRPNQDLQERLTRCEEMLKEYAAVKPERTSPSPSHAVLQEDLRWQPTGKLVQEDGNVRFVDNPLLGQIFDEVCVRAMREIVNCDDFEDDSTSTTGMTPDENSELLLGGDSPDVKVETLWPEPAQMFSLWQIYLDRVNPLTKIIHVPSLQPFVAEAAIRSPSVPRNIEALLFSIFLMAVVSLTPDECRALLSFSREEALQKYSLAVRLSLLQLNFLRCHDLTVLRALVIYLISLQGRYNRHAAWILNGIVIRIAQKMGLHRDGEALGLSPFECEMRRRLWWQIIMVDARYAILSGLSPSLLPTNSNTKAPKNVNDADIFPNATEPIVEREGPTEMIFCLLTYKFAKFLTDMPGFEGMILLQEGQADDSATDVGDLPTQEQVAAYRRAVGRLREELLEVFDKYCDPKAGPVHEMALTMREHVLDKLNELMTPPKERPDWGGEVKNAKDNTFKIAVNAFEHNEANYASTKDRGFAWFSLLHFQVDLFMYLAGQLCQRTEGNLVERAWRQVHVVYSYHPELFDVTNKNYAALALHILQAWKNREQLILSRTGQIPEAPFYIKKLRACMPSDIVECKEEGNGQKTSPYPAGSPDLTAATTMGALNFGISPEPSLGQFLSMIDPQQGMDWDALAGQPIVIPNGQPTPGFELYGMGPTTEW